MALRPLHFCEVLEEEHDALYGADDWRVEPSDVVSTDAAILRCQQVFGKDFGHTLGAEADEGRRKVRLAEMLTEKVVTFEPILTIQPPEEPADAAPERRERERRRRQRDELDARLAGAIRERGGWTYTAEQIRIPRLAAQLYREIIGETLGPAAWAARNVDAAKCVDDIVAHLNALICGEELLTAGPACHKIREQLCEDTLTLLASEKKFRRHDRRYLNRRILDEVLRQAVQSGPEARMAKQIRTIHEKGHTSALCLSGGGIRSATFGLGILQGLARRNLLDKFDYISTVSGGGYIGGWLSSWARRHPSGVRGVSGDLAAMPQDKLSPDPPPVQHLREFSNYLTPRVGALSGDTLTVVALYLRNLLLNWIVLVPLLVAALLLPWLLFAVNCSDVGVHLVEDKSWLGSGLRMFLTSETVARLFSPLASWLDRWPANGASWYAVGLGFLALSFVYLGASRPARNKYAGRRKHRLLSLGILPLVFASVALAAAWARYAGEHGAKTLPWLALLGIALLLPLAAVVYGLRFRFTSLTDQRETLFAHFRGLITPGRRFFIELLAVIVGSAVVVALLALLAQYVFPRPAQAAGLSTFPSPVLALDEQAPMRALYVVFAVPLILGVFFLCAAIFVAIASRVNQDYDREWWARCSGMTFAAIAIWILLTGVVVFGPVLIHLAPLFAASVGGATGIASYVLSRYRAMVDRNKAGASDTVETALSFVAPVFVVVLLAFVSLTTSAFFPAPAAGIARTTQLQHAERFQAWSHLRSLEVTPIGAIVAAILALIALALLASWSVNANKFSMHSMYRNRLIRAYLGASRLQRDPNPVTGFDPQDDLPMHALRPEFLWVGSFRDVKAFFQTLREDADPFIYRLRREVYRLRSEKDLDQESERDDFAAELAQVINCVLEQVDLDPEAKPLPEGSPGWLGRAWKTIRAAFVDERHDTPRLPGAVLRRNRERLDEKFATSLYAYDHPIVKLADVRDVDVLRELLIPPRTPFTRHLLDALGDEVKKLLSELRHDHPLLRPRIEVFTRELNRVMEQYDLECENLQSTGFLRLDLYPPSSFKVRQNRRRLDERLVVDGRCALHPLRSPRPMHLVNMALNLVRGDNLAWQERKAESFTTSPMHTGSYMLGYRDSSHYGDPSGITLGTAVAISGAAVSPNRGQKTSSALAFLMTLFNVRLGWWLGNPGVQGQRTWTKEGPRFAIGPLLAEASGDTNDSFPYVYLSDGGHFENLGLYEMVLRRRHYIVISDATCDRKYAFDDLGNAIRKIRTDLGIPIDIEKIYIYPKGSEKMGKYCALGTIRYSCVDEGGKDGQLLYIKPGVYMNEPTDIYNYAKKSDDFPHETTADQWFSESQFESYRMLGSHIIDQICGAGTEDRTLAHNWCAKSMADFFDKAIEYLGDPKDEPSPKPVPADVLATGDDFLHVFDEAGNQTRRISLRVEAKDEGERMKASE